jgi:hypothetical protein
MAYLSMALNADEMIAALDAFGADSGYDENQFRLYPITEGFKSLPDPKPVMAAMFSLMERFPDAYLGTPGPLVHSIESVGLSQYEPLLIESVQRQPTELNIWMVNRILNTALPSEHRRLLLDLMQSAIRHPRIPHRVAESDQRFLDHQSKRDATSKHIDQQTDSGRG